jgi:hypothetical protein
MRSMAILKMVAVSPTCTDPRSSCTQDSQENEGPC